jgi:sec-independent protein translocase protein TatA
MGLSATHIILVLAVAFLLFGRGKISELMGDVAKGIKSFKKGLAEDDANASPMLPLVESDATLRERSKVEARTL